MSKKTGLGKGLDALFGSNSIIEEQIQKDEKVQFLKVIDIEPNVNQPRRFFDEESLDELAQSIKTYGIIQPIVVAPKNGFYEIIAGERRWRASKKAGLTEVPVIIREYDERKNKEIALIENVQREDLNPIEKARGFKQLMDDYGLTQQELGDIVGKCRSSIANTVRILNLDERVIQLALEGKLTEGHCKALLAVQDTDKQFDMAIYMIETGKSVREAEKRVAKRKIEKKKDVRFESICRDIENSFQGFFGTKVRLDPGKRKGKIVIEYTNNEDLERILNLIK